MSYDINMNERDKFDARNISGSNFIAFIELGRELLPGEGVNGRQEDLSIGGPDLKLQ